MQRYFGEVLEGRVILSENDVFHLVKVMRCKIGTEIEIVSDGRVFLARVEQVKPLLIKVLKSIKENTELPSDIVLILAALKGDKNDIVLQKATELGVREIDIFFSERTIVKLKPSECDGKLSRYRRIVKEASEQSRRSRIPLVSFLTSFNDAVNVKAQHRLIAYEEQSGSTTIFNNSLKKIKKGERVAVIIGPEGGFTSEEIDIAKQRGFNIIGLGRRILRAETAAIYAISVIANHLENQS